MAASRRPQWGRAEEEDCGLSGEGKLCVPLRLELLKDLALCMIADNAGANEAPDVKGLGPPVRHCGQLMGDVQHNGLISRTKTLSRSHENGVELWTPEFSRSGTYLSSGNPPIFPHPHLGVLTASTIRIAFQSQILRSTGLPLRGLRLALVAL